MNPETGPFEIERKYLIKYPDIRLLESMPNCRKVAITQIYLTGRDGECRRIRQWSEDGQDLYFKTLKRDVTDVTRIEIEEPLSREEYLALIREADPTRFPIRKTRYCLTYDNQCFEIDVYPFWQDRATMEIELRAEDDEIRFPPQVEIIREVTEDRNYRNSALAKNGGKF